MRSYSKTIKMVGPTYQTCFSPSLSREHAGGGSARADADGAGPGNGWWRRRVRSGCRRWRGGMAGGVGAKAGGGRRVAAQAGEEPRSAAVGVEASRAHPLEQAVPATCPPTRRWLAVHISLQLL